MIDTKTFKAYLEDWEEETARNRCIDSSYKLLEKYGGIKYINADANPPLGYTIYSKRMEWYRFKCEKNTPAQWVLLGVPKGVSANEENYESFDKVCISEDLIWCITATKQENIRFVNPQNKIQDSKELWEEWFPERPYIEWDDL